jgi:hypothetical protein
MLKKTWYVYEATMMWRRRYIGLVKAKTGKKAIEIARRKFGRVVGDVIQKKYIADRAAGTMRGPKKKQ